MWFRNLSVFRLPKNYALSADKLHSFLTRKVFAQCLSSDMSSQGWASPRENDQLVHTVNNQFLLKFATEKKLLPSSVVNQVTKARAAELEEQQGFAPGRKALKDLKERITDELLPRAFSVQSNTYVWVDPVNGWLVIDSSSASKCDEIVKHLLKCIDTFPLESLRVKLSPQTAMTEWLIGNEAPKGFTIDQDANLQSHTEDKATVRYIRHTMDVEDIQRHIVAGKHCTSLALTWNDRISFVLTETLMIKKIHALHILDEKEEQSSNEDERFDADFVLMTSELATMLDDIAFALGGEMEQMDLVSESAKAAA